MAKTTTKLSKKDIDQRVLRALQIKELQKELADELKIIQTELDAQFQLPADQKEEIFGKETFIQKAPTDLGKNSYDVELLKPILKKVRKLSQVIKRVETIDTTALNQLVKEGVITQEDLNACRVSRWTFKTFFKRIENKQQKTA